MGDLLIRRASLGGRTVDVRITGGRIVEVLDAGDRAGHVPAGNTDELDAAGAYVLPGIHDHHIHLRALAAARASVAAGPPEVTDAAQLERSLMAAARSGTQTWIRAVGYHEAVAGELDRSVLDRMVAHRPVRVQHRSGILWVLNSVALELLAVASDPSPGIERDASGRPTGRLWRMDDWLSDKTSWLPEDELLNRLGDLSIAAAAAGVTGWTDATPGRSDREAALLARSVATGNVRQRLHLMVRPDQPAGGADGGDEDLGPLVTTGAVKVLLDDFDPPPLSELVATVRAAHAKHRPVAIHCVSRTQIVLAVAALEEAGGPVRGDRIEHGSVIPPDLIPLLRNRGGATVVTQPNFVHERGDDYLRDVEPEELPNLWRAGSLVAAGVRVAAGTDAPFGSEDPWEAIRAATTRTTLSGAHLGDAERVGVDQAFAWFCGPGPEPGNPRRAASGQPGDLILLDASLEEVVEGGGPPPLLATVVGGRVIYP